MRALYIPHTSSPRSLATDHSYGWATGFFKKWMIRNPDVSVSWVVPRGALTNQIEAFYKLDGFMDRCRFIECDMSDNQIREQGVLQREIVEAFDFDNQRNYFDIVFCEKPGVLGLFMAGIGIPKRNSKFKTIVCNFHYAMDAVKEMDVTEQVECNYFVNATSADAFLFACDDTCNIDSWGQFLKKINKYCSSSVISKCIQKPRWVKAATDYEEVKKVYEDWTNSGGLKPSDEFRIHYGYSTNKNFNYEEVSRLVGKYQLANQKIKFVVTTPSLGDGEKMEKWKEFHGQCPRPRFFEIAKRSHISIMWTEYDAGLNHGSVMEMTALGVLPVFYRNAIPFPWDKSYPFTFTNDVEFISVVKGIQKNWGTPIITDWIEKNHALLDKTFATRSGNNLVIDWAEEEFKRKMAAKAMFCPWNSLLELLPLDEYSIDDVMQYIKESSIVKADLSKVVAGTGRYRHGTMDNVRTWMMQNGWRDCGDATHVVMKRNKETI